MTRDIKQNIDAIEQMRDTVAEELVPSTLGDMVVRLHDTGSDISPETLIEALMERAHSHPDERRQLIAAARRIGWSA